MNSPSPSTPRGGRRWLTPSSLLLTVFAAELLLAASARFQWLPIHQHKGWTVLLCAAFVGASLLFLLLWLVLAKAFGRGLQFTLRSLMLLVAVVAVPCGWLTNEIRAARRQREIVAAAQNRGCGVAYDYNLTSSGGFQMFTGARPGATRLHALLGDDFFHDVAGAFARTDDALFALQELPSLRRLYLHDSQITDDGLKALARWDRLEWVDLRDASHVTDAGLKHLEGCPRLKVLMLRRTSVSDAGMDSLKNLAALETLDLGMTKVTDDGLKQLAGLTRLKELLFWGNKISDAGLVHLRGMTDLQTLEFGSNLITDAGLPHLTKLTRLESLNLRGAQVTDAGMQGLAGLSRLRLLDLFNTRISDAGLEQLSGLSQLETLRLGDTQVTDDGVEILQRVLSRCKIER